MSNYVDLLNDMALVIGGTAVSAPPLGFYSGAQAGDGTGVSGLKGCYSIAPLAILNELPVGILVPRSFTATLMQQGYEENKERIQLLILAAKVDQATDLNILYPFRDTVPAQLRAHMQADQISGATSLTPEPLLVFAVSGRMGQVIWNGINYYGWSFDIDVLRTPQVTYSP